MLQKRSLSICVVAVAFCLVAIESAEACYDWYWLVDCYEDYCGNFWVCWWDCYDCCLRWDCLEDSFVHHSEIDITGYPTLGEDQKVDFEVGQGKKGPCATNVIPG